jgi:hypothetical protein
MSEAMRRIYHLPEDIDGCEDLSPDTRTALRTTLRAAIAGAIGDTAKAPPEPTGEVRPAARELVDPERMRGLTYDIPSYAGPPRRRVAILAPGGKPVHEDLIAHMEALMLKLYEALEPQDRCELNRWGTVAIAQVMVDRQPRGVFTTNSNRAGAVVRAAQAVGLVRWTYNPGVKGRGDVGAPNDAEQLLVEYATNKGYPIHILAVSRDPCPDCREVLVKPIKIHGQDTYYTTVVVPVPDNLMPPDCREKAGAGPVFIPLYRTGPLSPEQLRMKDTLDAFERIGLGLNADDLAAQRRDPGWNRAHIAFLERYGARPQVRLWDPTEKRSYPADASLVGINLTIRYPYVSDIDADGLRGSIVETVRTYRDLVDFLDAAVVAGFIERDPPPRGHHDSMWDPNGRYQITVNRPDDGLRRSIDITETIRAAHETAMENTPLEVSNADAARLFRLRHGARTPIYRSSGNWSYNPTPIFNSAQEFGPDPWVFTVGPEAEHGLIPRGVRMLVQPANEDAVRATLFARYEVASSIGHAYAEVTAGGRPILLRLTSFGFVSGFVAGPDADGRFGVTRYIGEPGSGITLATGELKRFWVDKDDLVPVPRPEGEQELRKRLARPRQSQ